MWSDFFNHHRVFSNQAVFQPIDALYHCVFQEHAMLQHGRIYLAAVANRSKRTDKRVFDENVFADDDGPANPTSHNLAALSQLHSTGYIALIVHFSVNSPLNPIV